MDDKFIDGFFKGRIGQYEEQGFDSENWERLSDLYHAENLAIHWWKRWSNLLLLGFLLLCISLLASLAISQRSSLIRLKNENAKLSLHIQQPQAISTVPDTVRELRYKIDTVYFIPTSYRPRNTPSPPITSDSNLSSRIEPQSNSRDTLSIVVSPYITEDLMVKEPFGPQDYNRDSQVAQGYMVSIDSIDSQEVSEPISFQKLEVLKESKKKKKLRLVFKPQQFYAGAGGTFRFLRDQGEFSQPMGGLVFAQMHFAKHWSLGTNVEWVPISYGVEGNELEGIASATYPGLAEARNLGIVDEMAMEGKSLELPVYLTYTFNPQKDISWYVNGGLVGRSYVKQIFSYGVKTSTGDGQIELIEEKERSDWKLGSFRISLGNRFALAKNGAVGLEIFYLSDFRERGVENRRFKFVGINSSFRVQAQ